jgi:hypothetical protein
VYGQCNAALRAAQCTRSATHCCPTTGISNSPAWDAPLGGARYAGGGPSESDMLRRTRWPVPVVRRTLARSPKPQQRDVGSRRRTSLDEAADCGLGGQAQSRRGDLRPQVLEARRQWLTSKTGSSTRRKTLWRVRQDNLPPAARQRTSLRVINHDIVGYITTHISLQYIYIFSYL